MRILLTNDDGIDAPGLKVLEKIADELTQGQGDIWTVAPVAEKSGVAHCLSYSHPFLIHKRGPKRFAIEGYPADCVIAGLQDLGADKPFDLVLSGVNMGNNSGENAAYSGTLGAAMEGSLQDVPSIALSQYLGPKTKGLSSPFEASAAYGAKVIQKILAHDPAYTGGYRLFYNVNFPPVAASDVQGIRISHQGIRDTHGMGSTPQRSPSGRRYLWISGQSQQQAPSRECDITDNLAGYVSVTPMQADFTAHHMMAHFKPLEDE